ncbi:hypothetical protein N9B59_00685 [Flavobacteriales bacterium]|nr:hypothetical protein [Flavobacteriales bacterium]
MKELLVKPASKSNSLKIVELVGRNENEYKKLVEIALVNDGIMSDKATWAITHCHDNKQGFFCDYFPQWAIMLAGKDYSDSLKRSVLRTLQFVEIPEENQASIIDSCFELLVEKKSAVAVKAFSLGVLENMVKLYPELKNELISCIELLLPTASSGLKNRGKHILKRLSK